ncbi:MAG: TIGR00730 family Rossman fold protein [Bacteroidia bacterium]|nr:TIGR00730 family Rossman fold protein [Bacteroidia bacterium]
MNNAIKRIAIYCGSALGNSPEYKEAAIELVQSIHKRGMGIVYGGGNVGIMGVIADEMVRLGGECIGVIPHSLLKKELGHTGITRLIEVENMHQRKATMFELADACIALPGGIGTMEELFEAFTWTQLGFHDKPCGVLNVQGFYKPLENLLQHMVDSGFLKQEFKNLLISKDQVDELLDALQNFEMPKVLKWY